MITPQEALQRTIEHREIFHDEMLHLMRMIMRGELSPVMTASILTGLRVKKETIGEISAAAEVMREFSNKVNVHDRANLVDIVGTGGDGANTFNISTCSTFVISAAGGKVSKHGGRSVSSKSGSADAMEALGVNINLNAAQIADCIRDVGIGFMFAPNHHPAMKNVAPVRKELGVRTIFNILGPLTNPAGALISSWACSTKIWSVSRCVRCSAWGPSMHWSFMAAMAWTKSAWARAPWSANSRTAWYVSTRSTPRTLACAWRARARSRSRTPRNPRPCCWACCKASKGRRAISFA